MKYKTREEWLLAGVELLKPIFKEHGYKVPAKIRVSCGFPSKQALSNHKRRIGECWADKASEGKFFEIFISPVLSKPFQALDTLLHELIHATVGLEHKHRGEFKVCATKIGMKGKMTECGAGDKLKPVLEKHLKTLGQYPHDKLEGMTTGKKNKPRDPYTKASCPDCGYIIRTTRKWIETGMPICPCGGEFVES